MEDMMNKTNFSGAPIGPSAARALVPSRGGSRLNKNDSVVLLASDDSAFGDAFESAAAVKKRPIARINRLSELSRTIQAIHPAVVLLDLDLQGEAVWQSLEETLFEQETCPIVILLTRQRLFTSTTAVRVGALAQKSAGPERLLETVDRAVTARSGQVNRNAVPRALVRLVRPYLSQRPLAPVLSSTPVQH
jgi:DNA-binding NtrC family response regulator